MNLQDYVLPPLDFISAFGFNAIISFPHLWNYGFVRSITEKIVSNTNFKPSALQKLTDLNELHHKKSWVDQ